jgi:hypothetical protein
VLSSSKNKTRRNIIIRKSRRCALGFLRLDSITPQRYIIEALYCIFYEISSIILFPRYRKDTKTKPGTRISLEKLKSNRANSRSIRDFFLFFSSLWWLIL